MTTPEFALIETAGFWQVTRNGALLAGFAEKYLAEQFLLQELRAQGDDACRVTVWCKEGARYEWCHPVLGGRAVRLQLH
jgi:hypothetical protein